MEQAELPAGSAPRPPLSRSFTAHSDSPLTGHPQRTPAGSKGVGKRAHCGWLPVLRELAAVGRRGEQGGEATGDLSFRNKPSSLSWEAR